MSETKQFVKFFNQLLLMQIDDYENGLPMDKQMLKNLINKLDKLIMEEK